MESSVNKAKASLSQKIERFALSGESTLQNFKPHLICALRPIAEMFNKLGVSANKITLSGLIGSAFFAFLLLLFPGSAVLWLLFMIWVVVRLGLDIVDSILASEFGQKNAQGGALSDLCLVVSEALLVIPFAGVSGVSGIVIALFIWLTLLTEFAHTLADRFGSDTGTNGPFGKYDRAGFLVVAAFLALLATGIGGAAGGFLTVLVVFALVLLALTVYNRLKFAFKFDKKEAATPAPIAPSAP